MYGGVDYESIFLYGVNCTTDIWRDLKEYLSDIDLEFVEYPHELTKEAENISSITKWVYEKYNLLKVT